MTPSAPRFLKIEYQSVRESVMKDGVYYFPILSETARHFYRASQPPPAQHVLMTKPANILDQARAKLIWGEPADTVHNFLTSNGLSDIDADEKIAEWSAERNAEIRRIGIKKIFIGSALTLVASAHFFLAYQNACLGSSYRSAKGNAFIALIGCYGLWKLIDGIIYLIRPQSEAKSITELSE